MSRALDENSSVDTWVYTTPRKLKRAENAKLPNSYVYVLIRHTGVPIYVGKGTGRRAKRNFTKESENPYLRSIILKDRKAGYPELTILMAGENLISDEAFQLEMQTIAKYGRTIHGGTLTNMTDGGPGEVEGREAARVTKQFLHCQELAIKNLTRAPSNNLNECLIQANIKFPHLGRGLTLRCLFEKPSTVEELCDYIKTKGQPATKKRIEDHLWYVSRRLEEVTHFRIVQSEDGIFSVMLAS